MESECYDCETGEKHVAQKGLWWGFPVVVVRIPRKLDTRCKSRAPYSSRGRLLIGEAAIAEVMNDSEGVWESSQAKGIYISGFMARVAGGAAGLLICSSWQCVGHHWRPYKLRPYNVPCRAPQSLQ